MRPIGAPKNAVCIGRNDPTAAGSIVDQPYQVANVLAAALSPVVGRRVPLGQFPETTPAARPPHMHIAICNDHHKARQSGALVFSKQEAYKSFVKGRRSSTVDHRYRRCSNGVMFGALAVFGHMQGKIDFVFDRQGEDMKDRRVFHENGESFGWRWVDWSLTMRIPPIQAAEMVAWHIRDHADSFSVCRPSERP